ncbi:MAG: hypothetical protein SF069_03315 [Phycisphaerae bacterium]|nr:hypothetical protein [Phycisphaerae bacterium]
MNKTLCMNGRRWSGFWSLAAVVCGLGLCATGLAGGAAPFKHRVETYRAEDDPGTIAFVIRLEQPFLANEFEKSNFLRAAPLSDDVRLIYPAQTRFEKKHAAFFGRLHNPADAAGSAAEAKPARVRIDYETVTEALDGSREVRASSVEIDIPRPPAPGGDREIYAEWARMQTRHFAALLEYYPRDAFLQYVVLQSAERHGITAPALPAAAERGGEAGESELYGLLGFSSFSHEALQRKTLSAEPRRGVQDIHISGLTPPKTRRVDYAKLLEARRQKGEPIATPPTIAALLPADQYAVVVGRAGAIRELLELVPALAAWNLSNPTEQARDAQLQEHLERQLCISLTSLEQLSERGVIRNLALSGGEIPLTRGADFSLVLELAKPEEFARAFDQARGEAVSREGAERRQFSYRGHTIDACYSVDRRVSAFGVQVGEIALLSNSHVGIRRLIDTRIGQRDALAGGDDYRYFLSLLPAGDGAGAGYAFASEAFLRRLISPTARICERRRRQCENNLRMLANAALFYRLENGAPPASLSDLTTQRYVNIEKLICPHGGAYAFDGEREVGSCSLHNRLDFLTPAVEIETLQVSGEEKEEYARYRERHEAFWCEEFAPTALRWSAGPDRGGNSAGSSPGAAGRRFEMCTLPPTGTSRAAALRRGLMDKPLAALDAPAPAGAFATLHLTPGRAKIGEYLRIVPGMGDALRDDPTLTDLQWLGDRASVHLCDARQILEFDPALIEPIGGFVPLDKWEQSLIGCAITATSLPLCVVLEVEDAEKARRLLERLSSRIVLEDASWLGMRSGFDAYRLADYQGVARYVLSYRFHALKVRLHVALVGERLVAATTAETLQSVIDASRSADAVATSQIPIHAAFSLDAAAIDVFRDNLRGYWSERSRIACHANVIPLEMLTRLYGVTGAAAESLAARVFGDRHFCPEGGTYSLASGDAGLQCSVHGNRVFSRQQPAGGAQPAFDRLLERYRGLRGAVRFGPEATYSEIEILQVGGGRPVSSR